MAIPVSEFKYSCLDAIRREDSCRLIDCSHDAGPESGRADQSLRTLNYVIIQNRSGRLAAKMLNCLDSIGTRYGRAESARLGALFSARESGFQQCLMFCNPALAN